MSIRSGVSSGLIKGELCQLVNEEGLPIVDINEPVTVADIAFKTDSTGQFDDPDLLPLWTLSSAEKTRRKTERERILDLLEEEERIQEQQDTEAARERYKQEMEKRKEAAQKEMESLRKARELQKKMGRALMRSVVEGRDQAEKEIADQSVRDRLTAELRMPKKKSVSFADDIDEDGRIKPNKGKGVDWGDVAPGTLRPKAERQPMKMHVIERHPRTLAQSDLTPERDSDDDSDPGSTLSNNSENQYPAHGSDFDSDEDDAARRGLPGPDEDYDELPMDEDVSDWNGEDFDFAQHQREIALQYYEKRRHIGAEASSAMRAHTHDENEWDQAVSTCSKYMVHILYL